MERVSSMFFCLSLLAYYIPKLLKIKKVKYIKVHILAGIISIVAMILALVFRVGQESFYKYCGFTLIMLLIGLTGYLIKNKYIKYRKFHVLLTVIFFVYLYASIVIL